MISKNKKIIFVHIPKTGGTSIEKCLCEVFDEKINFTDGPNNSSIEGNIKNLYKNSYDSFKHSTIMELKNHYNDEDFNEFHKFAVIRNPWDRLLSLYRWESRGARYSKKQFLNYFNDIKEIDEYNKRTLWTINRYVCDEKDNIMVDTLLDFENLNSEFIELNSKLGLTENSLSHINKTRLAGTIVYTPKRYRNNFGDSSLNFREVMDEEVIQTIKRYYKKEIDKFWLNYEL